MKTIRVVAALVEREGRYLITQRRESAVLPLLWDFPGGRVEEGESDQAALVREVEERLGAAVRVGQLISFVNHPYEKYAVDLFLYECELLSDHLRCRAVRAYAWVTSKEMESYAFTPVDEASMSKLLGES
jgi:8-oxo-dGTP diphosphatase